MKTVSGYAQFMSVNEDAVLEAFELYRGRDDSYKVVKADPDIDLGIDFQWNRKRFAKLMATLLKKEVTLVDAFWV